METVQKLAEKVKEGLQTALPTLRKTVINKLALAVGARIEAQTPHTSELANVLPVPTEQQAIREPWWRRLLKNPLLDSPVVLEPFARTELGEAARNGQTVILSLDQTALGDRFAVLRLALQVGDRSLPLAWVVEAGAATIGFAGQQGLLERVRAWLPPDTAGLLLGDRFYPSAAFFTWWHQHRWQYRLRLKGNLTVDTGCGEATTGELAEGVSERDLPEVRRFQRGVPTNLGILREAGHEEPWIIAMDCQPTQAAVRDYGTRWVIEPTLADFKSRGFHLEDTQLQAPDRLDRLLLIMTLARYWCVRVGRHDALYHPTPLEKKPGHRPILAMGASKRFGGVSCLGSNAACGYCNDGCKPISPYRLSAVRS
ncbi:MAG TPA: transposase [Candidatus Competibacteraceae bacterium]|nr:transposase [Candidatus Competibacteraceae bacterium]